MVDMDTKDELSDIMSWLGPADDSCDSVASALDRKMTNASARLPMPREMATKPRDKAWRLRNSLEMWRAVRRMTQADLAGRVGVSRKTISMIENNKHEPTMGLALAIAEVLEAPVEGIFSLHRPRFPRYQG